MFNEYVLIYWGKIFWKINNHVEFCYTDLYEKHTLITNDIICETQLHGVQVSIVWSIDSQIQFDENETEVYPTGLKALGHQECADKSMAEWLINPLIRLMQPFNMDNMKKIFLFSSTTSFLCVIAFDHSNNWISNFILLMWMTLTYLFSVS